ncbi:bifunctional DNA primase/polymerase [Actinomycetospora cinnamomea]|uniref:Bifunctional DNA primase/polymerase-like protein n=1 Tax=Actinomycetospora cinnamomea TaxID=663609 RepID=A0A2U1F6R6_9PSEU|nr:bifunctional DNA primase/polymerase [Actinomycetospora cinnamomea]PVZ07858.1 bifunctional DNA primase/polymerase-like protein [Actinomycetospora cinnamomea]
MSSLRRDGPVAIPDEVANADIGTLGIALALAAAGHKVLPVRAGTKNPGSVVGAGYPAKASGDPHQLAEWFAGTDHGAALLTGARDLVVIDVDNPKAFAEGAPALAVAVLGSLAAPFQSTRRSVPGRGHYVFTAPPGRRFGLSAGALPGCDVRAGNGVIMVAGRHPDPDGWYRWQRTGPIPELPAAVAAVLPDAGETAEASSAAAVAAFCAEHTTPARSPGGFAAVVRGFQREVAAGGSRHTAAVTACCWAAREALADAYPAADAFAALAEVFVAAMADGAGGSRRVLDAAGARAEHAGIVQWAVAQALEVARDACIARLQRHDGKPSPAELFAGVWTGTSPSRTRPEIAQAGGGVAATPPSGADPGSDDGEGASVVETAGRGESGAAVPRGLDESFWSARPVLANIRQAAHARNRSAEVVLLSVLARLASLQHHETRVDTGLGPASLNMMVCAVGPSGAGKTSGIAIARDLIEAPVEIHGLRGDGYRDGIPLGSGEGLPELYMGMTAERHPTATNEDGSPKLVKRRGQVRFNVFAHVDEGEQMFRLAERSGSTLMPTLRSAWVAETIGQANASEETTRIIPAGRYSLGLVVGLQPTKAGPLFDDAAGGTPQRFLFASTSDPTIPKDVVEFPGLITSMLPPCSQTITMDDTIRARLRAEDRAVNTGELVRADLNAHQPLHLVKVSALLALLDGRAHVTEEDWGLARQVWESSCQVRETVLAEVKHAAAQEHARHAHRKVVEQRLIREDEISARDARLAKIEAAATVTVARRVWKHGGCRRRDLDRATSSRYRAEYGSELTEVAIERAIERGFIDPKGDDGYVPGAVRPEGA